MVRHIALSACLAVAALYVAAVATAQEDGTPPPRRFGNLSDRLDQFRQDLLGKKDAAPPQESDEPYSVTRKLTRKPRTQRPAAAPTPAMAPTASMPVESSEAIEGPALEPKANYSNLTAPNRLEPQAARRAQAGSTPSPTVVEPVEHPKGILDRIAPPRRPIIVRPPRMGGKENQAQVETSDAIEKPRHEARTAALPIRAKKDKAAPRAAVEPIDETEDQPVPAETAMPKPVPSTPHRVASRPRVNASVEDDEASPTVAAPLGESADATDESASQQPTLADSIPEPLEPSDGKDDVQLNSEAEAGTPTLAPEAKSEPVQSSKLDGSSPSDSTPSVASPATEETPGLLFTSASPVLSVEATGPRKVLIGKEASFIVKIKNAGAAANNVVVTINIPSYVEVHGAQATLGTAQPPEAGDRREPLQWKISRLDAGGEEVLNLKLVPRKSTPLDLAIQWTFVPEASQTQVEVQEPKLAMTISGPDEVPYGQSKIYKLTVSNPGNGDTENVVVGLLPIGRSADGAPNHRLGTLAAGESKTIDIELAARQAGAITIKAQAFADGGLRAEATEQVMVRRASLRVDVLAPKVKYAATVGTYRVKVTNAGDASAENVQVTSMLPPETKFVSTTGGGRLDPQLGKVTWNVGSLQAGGERVFELECALLAPGENRTQFVVVADGDLSASTTSTTHVEALADLKLEVRDPQGPIAIGDEAVYEVQIRNRGTKMAEHIDLCVFFSEGLEASSVDGPAHEIATGQVIFKPIVSIGPGDAVNIRVHARAEKPGNHVFRAELTSHHPTTKLAAEEATHFYGEEKLSRAQPREDAPTPARRNDGPTLAEEAEPQDNDEPSRSE